MTQPETKLPAGWDESKLRDVIEHYESQTDDEAVAEDEAAFTDPAQTVMLIPCDLVPAVQKLLAEADRS